MSEILASKTKLSLVFGALVEPIGSQLKAQGFPVNRARARAFQDIADAITLLKVHGYVPDSAGARMRKKLLAKIVEVLPHGA